jgi:hypothetical protein
MISLATRTPGRRAYSCHQLASELSKLIIDVTNYQFCVSL